MATNANSWEGLEQDRMENINQSRRTYDRILAQKESGLKHIEYLKKQLSHSDHRRSNWRLKIELTHLVSY